jgi:N utilization substance protein B
MDPVLKKSSECVLHYLYSWGISKGTQEGLTPFSMEMLAMSKKNVTAAMDRAEKIIAVVEAIDKLIDIVSKEYRLERISEVDRNILRFAIYEIYYGKKEKKSVINEAMRLSKKFSVPSSSSFVHAVLDEAAKSQEPV